ncbi:MAG: carboxypeptidase-like regulatory domain-containing protein [Thiohalocapsa sp.]|uniref:carboxypeptidase-like regulatory domain-containing protein n=1 Tax=Thiohalocapsa sp. TaxID=2497641 RepID=UPI0025E1FEBE|nr:carboxypeptidase-like regulatory domain-containing protein [Thiohalocapsa sp.]MCG6943480.1 carboxypeptidase-like regulatory domain-containing protein [Thiohalocapsa sp.]
MQHRLLLVILACCAVVLPGSATAMGKAFVMCSAWNARLIHPDGSPAAGVRLTRTWKWAWNGTTGSDSATTDADGRFRFPEATASGFFAALLPHESHIAQRVEADTPDGPITIWRASKRDYDSNGELDGRPLDLVCTLTGERMREGLFISTCVEADKP